MLQNHIGELQYPVKGNIKSVSLKDFEGFSKLKVTLPQIAIIISLLGMLFSADYPGYKVGGIILFGILICACLYFIYSQYKSKANEPITQQQNYYAWGNVSETTPRQLEALQLIAFSRYKDGYWTDTLESEPAELRVKHIKNFRKKLDWFTIDTQEEVTALWAGSWGMTTRKKYEKSYHDLLKGLHTSEFLLAYKEDPKWKKRLLELTDLPESYFDSCFTSNTDKPKKLIWAWDLWRAISITTGAFEIGLINEKEAWNNIYKVADIAHYLFEDIEDFYNNIRLGHAYWSNDEKEVYERKVKISTYLNPTEGSERKTHAIGWTKTNNIELPDNMADNFEAYMKKKESKEKTNPIGFKTNHNNN